VQYLTDHITGKPQHTYAMSRYPGYGGTTNPSWLAQSTQQPLANPDKNPPKRWDTLSSVASMSGNINTAFPQLHLEVTVPATPLPVNQMGREVTQMLYVAWLESGIQCPVIGCKPWVADDRQPLRRPRAMILHDRAHLARSVKDRSKMEPPVV
jgi:hypothetical protein